MELVEERERLPNARYSDGAFRPVPFLDRSSVLPHHVPVQVAEPERVQVRLSSPLTANSSGKKVGRDGRGVLLFHNS